MPDNARALRPDELLAQAAWLRRLASALVGGASDADDLVQETWLAALRRPPRVDAPDGPEPPLRRWLAEVLRNAARMRVRGATRRVVRDERYAAEGEGEAPSPEALLERLGTQRLLAELVAGLSEPYRSTLLLHYYEGLSCAEIARLQRAPAGTVRWRLKTGLERLREGLDRESGGERRLWCAALWPLAAPEASRWMAWLKGTLKGAWIMGRATKTAAAAATLAAAAGTAVMLSRPGPPGPPIEAAGQAAARGPEAATKARPGDPEARRARDAMREEIVASLRRREGGAPAGAAAPPPRAAAGAAAGARAPGEADAAETPLPRGHYEASYIQEVFREAMFPLLSQCYQNALAQRPKLAGKLVLSFAIVADPEVGGVVDEADFAPGGELNDAEMERCARESLMTLTFDKPPSGGGYVTVNYPVTFAPDGDEGEGEGRGRGDEGEGRGRGDEGEGRGRGDKGEGGGRGREGTPAR
ncbi:MAG TPA: sigma-70 family RNA polymerase sigma factor [Polyangiaceae bacterium]|nr:sigma-70 family RNA polymerase sigma factor [Polyangiaceae bacterium]